MLDPVRSPTGHSSHNTIALVQVGRWLRSQGYTFVAVTPATHALVLRNRTELAQRQARAQEEVLLQGQGPAQGQAEALDLRDIFGWNLPFAEYRLPAHVLSELRMGGYIEEVGGGLLRSAVRFSSLGGLLFPHSSFPTVRNESVFFGPDTYRFARLIERELRARPLPAGAHILDVGCGAGAGGLVAATCPGSVDVQVTLSDISPAALEFARASVDLAGQDGVRFSQADLYSGVAGAIDLIVANPPYLNDGAQRLYRHGGGTWGEALSIRILREGLPLLSRGGRLVLYTGSAIAQGVDHLHEALRADLNAHGCDWTYEEIDPDIFGEELQSPAYAGVDRIAAVSLVVQKP